MGPQRSASGRAQRRVNLMRRSFETDLPEVEVVLVLDGRVVLVDLGGQLILQLLRFFQVRMDFLLLPGFSVHTISDRRGAEGPRRNKYTLLEFKGAINECERQQRWR